MAMSQRTRPRRILSSFLQSDTPLVRLVLRLNVVVSCLNMGTPPIAVYNQQDDEKHRLGIEPTSSWI